MLMDCWYFGRILTFHRIHSPLICKVCVLWAVVFVKFISYFLHKFVSALWTCRDSEPILFHLWQVFFALVNKKMQNVEYHCVLQKSWVWVFFIIVLKVFSNELHVSIFDHPFGDCDSFSLVFCLHSDSLEHFICLDETWVWDDVQVPFVLHVPIYGGSDTFDWLQLVDLPVFSVNIGVKESNMVGNSASLNSSNFFSPFYIYKYKYSSRSLMWLFVWTLVFALCLWSAILAVFVHLDLQNETFWLKVWFWHGTQHSKCVSQICVLWCHRAILRLNWFFLHFWNNSPIRNTVEEFLCNYTKFLDSKKSLKANQNSPNIGCTEGTDNKLIYTRHVIVKTKNKNKKNLGKVALRENLGAQAGFYFWPVPTIIGITHWFGTIVLFATEMTCSMMVQALKLVPSFAYKVELLQCPLFLVLSPRTKKAFFYHHMYFMQKTCILIKIILEFFL